MASGAAVGLGLAKLERASAARRWADRGTLLSLMMASAVLLVGLNSLLGANGVFAAFVAGIALDHARDEISEQEAKVQQSVKNFFQLPVFLLFGMLIPWRAWIGIGLGGVAFAVLVLLLRRVPLLFALKPLLRPVETWRDAAFLGWFGPIGVAALYYALYAKQRTGQEVIWTVASLVVATSIVVHGLTAYPLSRWLGRRERPHQRGDTEEPDEAEDTTGEAMI